MTPDWPIYLITDRRQVGDRGLVPTIESALRGGVRAVQLREKDLPVRGLLALARELRELTERAGAHLLINGRIDVMSAVGADGVHLRADSLPTAAARRVIGSGKLLGVSSHSMDEAVRAEEEGADFVTFGPVYETPSKAGYGPPVGPEALRAVCRRLRIPVYALGGVSRARIGEVFAAGASGAAMISQIMSSGDSFTASRACVERARDAMRHPSVDHP
ncbi:MAG: thiamine phosphate synthase [Nitrospirota bacterium]